VSSSEIYWSSNTAGIVALTASIGEASLSGGGVDNGFITGQVGYGALAVYDGYLYWEGVTASGTGTATTYTRTIGRATVGGAGINTGWVTSPDGIAGPGLAVGPTGIYFVNGGEIGHASLDGTSVNPELIAEANNGGPEGLALDANYLHWPAGYATVGRSNLAGSGVKTSFIKPSGSVSAVALSASGSKVSGTVYGDACTSTCSQAGLPGVRMLVTGKASDGAWSVRPTRPRMTGHGR
jgi:hypothetical protein